MQLWTCWSSYELRDKRETSSRLRLCGLGTALATVSCMLDMILHDFACVWDLFGMLLVGSRASMQLSSALPRISACGKAGAWQLAWRAFIDLPKIHLETNLEQSCDHCVIVFSLPFTVMLFKHSHKLSVSDVLSAYDEERHQLQLHDRRL